MVFGWSRTTSVLAGGQSGGGIVLAHEGGLGGSQVVLGFPAAAGLEVVAEAGDDLCRCGVEPVHRVVIVQNPGGGFPLAGRPGFGGRPSAPVYGAGAGDPVGEPIPAQGVDTAVRLRVHGPDRFDEAADRPVLGGDRSGLRIHRSDRIVRDGRGAFHRAECLGEGRSRVGGLIGAGGLLLRGILRHRGGPIHYSRATPRIRRRGQ